MNRYYIVINITTNEVLEGDIYNSKGTGDVQIFFTSLTVAQSALKEYCLDTDTSYTDMAIFSVEAPRVHEATVSHDIEGKAL